MEKAKSRQLHKQIAGTDGVFTFTQGIVSNFVINGEGWEYVPQSFPTNAPCLVNRQYIDLQGLSLQELTLFFQSFDIQKDKMPVGSNTSRIFEYDIITTRAITDDELSTILLNPPSFIGNTVDLMTCTFGLRKSYGQNTTIPFTFVGLSEDTFGSGRPNATDRLHWTRVLLFEAATAEPPEIVVSIYPTNLVVQAISAEEKTYIYLERLRRSYELA